MRLIVLLVSILTLIGGPAMSQTKDFTKMKAEELFDVWVEDSLVKVLEKDEMQEDSAKEIVLDVARGEKEDAQIVIRPIEFGYSMAWVKMTCPPPANGQNNTIPSPRVRYIDFVPVRVPSQGGNEHLIALSTFDKPAFLPDPLYDIDTTTSWYQHSRSAYLTFDIPRDAIPGTYESAVTINANGHVFTVPVKIHVHKALVPEKRNLTVTNWLHFDVIASHSGCQYYDERFWKVLEGYAKNLYEHRQNMVITPIAHFFCANPTVGYKAEGDTVVYDFTNFDKWVQTFLDAGLDYIEGGHIGISGKIYCYSVKDGKVITDLVDATDPRAEEHLADFLPKLYEHLKEKGWTNIYYQHIMDEPSHEHKEQYETALALVRKHMPEVKTMDATLSEHVELPDVIIPIICAGDVKDKLAGNFHAFYDYYKEKQKEGKTLWYYYVGGIASTPYVSRQIDHRLLRTRYENWINFKTGTTGFLHWGYNWWDNLSPYTQLIPVIASWGGFPTGDNYLVYPSYDGTPQDSIRHEATRDSREDYELLFALDKYDSKKAHEICDSVILSMKEYEMDIAKFRKARLELLNELDKHIDD